MCGTIQMAYLWRKLGLERCGRKDRNSALLDQGWDHLDSGLPCGCEGDYWFHHGLPNGQPLIGWASLRKVKPKLTTGPVVNRASCVHQMKWRFVSNWVCRIEAVRLTKVWVIYIPLPPSIVLIAKYRVVQVKSSHWSPVLWQSLKCCLGWSFVEAKKCAAQVSCQYHNVDVLHIQNHNNATQKHPSTSFKFSTVHVPSWQEALNSCFVKLGMFGWQVTTA